jgi:membrane protease YdiL (CAAX protease family)
MKNNRRIIYGLILTIIAFLLAQLAGRTIQLNVDFLPYSFVTHSAMLVLAIVLICSFKKYVNYKIACPKFKKIWKPALFGFLSAVIVNGLLGAIGEACGIEQEAHFAFDVMSPLQVFLFIFILASVAEETLFRGFLQNLLKPLSDKKIKLFKRNLTLPVFIAAIAFSLAHLILITSDAGAYFIFRTLAFTFVLGLIAGYYQEKYDNNAYAIIVHMSGNFMGLVGAMIGTANFGV